MCVDRLPALSHSLASLVRSRLGSNSVLSPSQCLYSPPQSNYSGFSTYFKAPIARNHLRSWLEQPSLPNSLRHAANRRCGDYHNSSWGSPVPRRFSRLSVPCGLHKARMNGRLQGSRPHALCPKSAVRRTTTVKTPAVSTTPAVRCFRLSSGMQTPLLALMTHGLYMGYGEILTVGI